MYLQRIIFFTALLSFLFAGYGFASDVTGVFVDTNQRVDPGYAQPLEENSIISSIVNSPISFEKIKCCVIKSKRRIKRFAPGLPASHKISFSEVNSSLLTFNSYHIKISPALYSKSLLQIRTVVLLS